MHIFFFFGLLVCQSPESVDSPRIQPLPFQITFQTKRKPVFQDAPPSTFVPPSSLAANQSFDPKGQFQSTQPDMSDPLGSGFQKVDPDQVKPLRKDATLKTDAPSSRFSLQSDADRASGQSAPPRSTLQSSDFKANGQSSDATSDATPSKFLKADEKRTTPQSKQLTSPPFNPQSIDKQNSSAANSPARPFRSNRQQNIQQPNRDMTGEAIQRGQAGSAAQSAGLSPQTNPRGNRFDSSQDQRALVPKQGVSPDATNEVTREVKDSTYDPQLKEITELILKTIPRPDQNRLSLQQAVAYARNADHRKQIIKQYWSCFVTLADQKFAEQELRLLADVPSPRTQLDQFLLRAANSAAQARFAEARIAYQKSAAALHRLVPRFKLDQPLSFADLPWVGKYQTNSTGFVTAGIFSDQIRKVDTALPAIRDLIYLRGAAVYDNMAALRESMTGYENGSIKLETLLSLHKEVRDQRIEFCKNIRSYNHAIADYAISVFPTASHPQTVVNMLIDPKQTLSDTIRDRNVRQASGNAPIQNQAR